MRGTDQYGSLRFEVPFSHDVFIARTNLRACRSTLEGILSGGFDITAPMRKKSIFSRFVVLNSSLPLSESILGSLITFVTVKYTESELMS